MSMEIIDGYVALRRTCRDFMGYNGVASNPGFSDDDIAVGMHELLLGACALPIGMGPERGQTDTFDTFVRFRTGIESILRMANIELPEPVTAESITQALSHKV